jgi:O-antigen/teichoic acid export membrane protein
MSDVVLVKHFFEPHLAGIYASLSTMGKIIFYGAAPISAVMFPLVSKVQARGGNYRKVFFLSMLLTSAMVFFLIFVYWLFPELVLQILYGDKFLEGAPYLVWFGIFIGLFALVSLLLNYFLSKGTTRVVYFALLAAVGQIIGIYFFHQDLIQVISVSIWISLILLLSLLIYFGYEAREKE